ncbi:anti-sigma factor antagonist [Streptomyces griseoluteus]|uniref:Anti-sigma factor antagonist n=1 Tax=Streptomyces griseoluteus TaxID=29306 RepID=A0A4Z1CYY3_STRGP|nr:STAS domain-containing protein [Streptomyces griseoluteus]TGN74384.1 anti-sigma factor antagonist [Streptomyces griseoluteus]
MNSLLRIDTADTRSQATALTVTGPVDLANASVLEQTVDEALNHHPTVILDLTGVTFCDSSGLNTLIRLRRRAQHSGGELILAAPPPQMMRMLRITGADSVFTIHGSLAEAWQTHPASGTPPTE